jgi:hypothetical protein
MTNEFEILEKHEVTDEILSVFNTVSIFFVVEISLS